MKKKVRFFYAHSLFCSRLHNFSLRKLKLVASCIYLYLIYIHMYINHLRIFRNIIYAATITRAKKKKKAPIGTRLNFKI